MKRKLTILSFVCCCLLAVGLVNCNNKPATDSEATTTDTLAEENPMNDGDNYTDPVETKIDTNTINNNGLVFIEMNGTGVDGATYTVKDGDRTVSQGVTKDGGKFNTADMQNGKTYNVTVSARGYREQTKTVTYNGEAVKVGLTQ